MTRRFLLCLLFALTPIAAPAVAADSKDAKARPAAEQKAGALIDINSAKAAELMTLDGIGEARAKAIIKGRPYRAKNELADREVISRAHYERIKDRIVARQGAAKK